MGERCLYYTLLIETKATTTMEISMGISQNPKSSVEPPNGFGVTTLRYIPGEKKVSQYSTEMCLVAPFSVAKPWSQPSGALADEEIYVHSAALLTHKEE